MSDIGKPQRIIIAEPIYSPVRVPREEPAVTPAKPEKTPEPEKVPA